jgi:hypothetical protein
VVVTRRSCHFAVHSVSFRLFFGTEFQYDPWGANPERKARPLDIPHRYVHYFESGIVLVWIT